MSIYGINTDRVYTMENSRLEDLLREAISNLMQELKLNTKKVCELLEMDIEEYNYLFYLNESED